MAIPTSALWPILAFTEGLDISGWFDTTTEGTEWSVLPPGGWGVGYFRDATNKRIEIHDSGFPFTQMYPVITAGSIGTGNWKTQVKFVPDIAAWGWDRSFGLYGGSPDSGLGNGLGLRWYSATNLWDIRREDVWGMFDFANDVDLTPVPGTTLDILMEYDSVSGLVTVTINGTVYGSEPAFPVSSISHDQSLYFYDPTGQAQFIDEWLIGVSASPPPPSPTPTPTIIIDSGGVSLADRPRRTLESVPSFEPEAAPGVFGGNFEELFHGEFSEFIEAQPIVDTIAPGCPTNLSCVVNTKNRTMFFSWYWPSTYSSDGSIQNDIKEFEFFTLEDGEHSLLSKTRIPKYSFYVNDTLLEKSKNEGLMFAVRAVDYHGLTSEYSKTILVKLNKNYGCKEKETNPIFVSNECGKAFNKKYVLNKKIIINKDQIKLLIGSHIAIKEPFISRNNTLLLTIKDLNTGKIFEISLTVENTQQINRDVVYSPTFNKTLDILASIRSGRTRF